MLLYTLPIDAWQCVQDLKFVLITSQSQGSGSLHGAESEPGAAEKKKGKNNQTFETRGTARSRCSVGLIIPISAQQCSNGVGSPHPNARKIRIPIGVFLFASVRFISVRLIFYSSPVSFGSTFQKKRPKYIIDHRQRYVGLLASSGL